MTNLPHRLISTVNRLDTEGHPGRHITTMRSSLASAALALALASTAQSAIVEHWWNISYATANPDGVSFIIQPFPVFVLTILVVRKTSHRYQRNMAVSQSFPIPDLILTFSGHHRSTLTREIPSESTLQTD